MVVARAQPVARFYLLHLGGALLLAAAALLIVEQFRIDWRVSNLFFDSELGRFPLRDDWFLEKVMHVGIKNAVVGVGVLVLIAWIFSFRLRRLAKWRPLLLFLFVAMLLSSSAVSLIKSVSGKHCPYDLEQYGGTVPFVGLLEQLPPGVEPGKCWPGGHASAGFCLFAFYFAALKLGRRRMAAAILAGSLLLGLVLGMARVVQGAHFVSHNLWSALICWLVVLALYEVLLRRVPLPKGD
jgi:membrane-associated PAP2 superfamily phosphatase